MSEPIKSIEEFISWTEQLEGRLLLFRGLADTSWEVSASAYRRIKTSPENVPAPSIFQNCMKQLLNNASLRGFREQQGKSLSDLELLATLQHHGAATCLIDFTSNPLVALWFACQEKPKQTGKVVAMSTDNIELFSTVSYQDLEKSIEEFLYKDNKLWKWIPSHLSSRILAQQSVFVFGRGKIEEPHYKEVRIDGANKEKIKEELKERFGITEQYIFSDFTGFALANAHDRPYIDYTADDHNHLGIEFHQRGDFQKAIAAYDQAIKLNPRDNDIVYNNRGIAKGTLGDYQGAIADYNKALGLNPQFYVAYYGRGLAKYFLGNHQGAITDYDKAIEINVEYSDAYINRGIAKHTLGDHHGALADYDKAIEINPKSTVAYFNRGLARSSLFDVQGAISDYDSAIKCAPQYVEAYFSRGVAKYGLKDYQGAISDYDKVIELNPQYPGAYHNRGIAKRESGDEAGANEDSAKAKQLVEIQNRQSPES